MALGQIFEYAIRTLIVLILARYLGAERYGLYVLAVSIATMFAGISTIGLDRAMVRYVAILAARKDRPGLWGTIQVGIGVSMTASLVMSGVLYALGPMLASTVFDAPQLGGAFRLMAFVTPFLTMSNMLLGTAHGFRRMGTAVVAENVVQSLVRVVLLFGIVTLSTLDLTAALIVFAISDLAAIVAFLALLSKTIPYEKESRLAAHRDSKAIFGFAIPLWLSSLLRHFRRNIESLLLGAMSAATSVAVFAVAARINDIGRIAYLSTLAAVKPIIAALHDQQDHGGLARIYKTATRWTFTFSLPFFVLVLLVRTEIIEIFGGDFSAGTGVLLVLAAAELFNAGTGICGSIIDMTGHAKLKLLNSTGWVVLQVGGAALLIPRLGVMGAALASFVAIAVVNIATVLQIWFLERLWPYDRSFWKPLIAAGLATVSGLGMTQVAAPASNFALVVIVGATISLTYVAVLAAFRLEPDDRLILQHVLGRLRPAWSTDGDCDRRPVRTISGEASTRSHGPVFVVGTDRAGKTTLAGILNSHPSIAIPDFGTNYWTEFHKRFGDLSSTSNGLRAFEAIVDYDRTRMLAIDPEGLRSEFLSGPRTYAHLFSLPLEHYARSQGKPRWGAQSGMLEVFADIIIDAYPGARIIHMIRDPRDRFVAARHRASQGRGGVGAAAARWLHSVSLAERNALCHPDQYLVLRYEDLVTAPEDTVRKVCSFIDEDYKEHMLEFTGSSERRSRLLGNGTGGRSSVLSDEFVGTYRSALPPIETFYLEQRTAAKLDTHGYERQEIALTWIQRMRYVLATWPSQRLRGALWNVRTRRSYGDILTAQPDESQAQKTRPDRVSSRSRP